MDSVENGKKTNLILVLVQSPVTIGSPAAITLATEFSKYGLSDKNLYYHGVMRNGGKPPKDITDAQDELEYLNTILEVLNPRLVFCVGNTALKAMFPDETVGIARATTPKLRGHCIPCHKYDTWVVPILSPGFFLNKEKQRSFYLKQMGQDIGEGLKLLQYNVTKHTDVEYTVAGTAPLVEKYLLGPNMGFCGPEDIVSFDFETTGLRPDTDELLTVALSSMKGGTVAIPLDKCPKVRAAFARWLLCPCKKVVTEINMENIWAWAKFGILPVNVIRDTEIMTHISDQREGTNSLAWRAFAIFGEYYKDMVDRKDLANADRDLLLRYNAYDAYWTLMLYYYYEKRIEEQGRKKALDLLSSTSYIYTKMTCNGIKIDTEILDKVGEGFIKRIEDTTNELETCAPVVSWNNAVGIYNSVRPIYTDPSGKKSKPSPWTSTGKLCNQGILFDILGEPILFETPKGSPKMDAASLEATINQSSNRDTKDFLEGMLSVAKLKTIVGCYKNLHKNLWTDSRIHPKFKLNICATYRSSSRDPNLQNQHKHGEGVALRKAFVPTNDLFIAADYGAMEVRIIAYTSQDPVLLGQLNDNYDLHAYWASKVFKVVKPTKEQRYMAKNMFVFPLFYGSWYKPIAESLGITERHARKVESDFWKMYARVSQWHDELEQQYLEEGGLTIANGFFIPGPLTRNDIFNYPIQGPASHFLAESCIELDSIYQERGFESFLCGQIHDDVITDAVRSEAQEVIKVVKEVMETPRFGLTGAPLLSEFSIGLKDWFEMTEIGG